jgi:hypothetical protein
MLERLVEFVKYLIRKIRIEINKKFIEKDATVLLLFLLCYGEFIPLVNPIYQEIIPLVFDVTLMDNQDLMNMGKSIIFRLLNRLIKKKQRIEVEVNRPVKRKFEEFLMFRFLGGRVLEGTREPTANLMTLKTENFYYPITNL